MIITRRSRLEENSRERNEREQRENKGPLVLKPGDRLRVHYVDAWPAKELGVRKGLLLATRSITGGRNNFFAWVSVLLGLIALGMGVVLLTLVRPDDYGYPPGRSEPLEWS